jgi:flagellar biosynthesis protein FliR
VLQQLLPGGVFAFLLVFARVGSSMMVMPGFGESFVVARVRLAIALVVTFALTPVLAVGLPKLPAEPLALVIVLITEIGVGIFIGLAARLTLSALHVAGTVMAFQGGLGFAQFFDPTQGSQGTLIATYLTLMALALIFATDLHLLLVRAVHDSYTLFPPAAVPPLGDFAKLAVDLVAGSFVLGVQIAAPFLVYGLAFNIGLGILARLMPQLSVFFIAVPVQILLSFALLAMILATGSLWFLEHFTTGVARFLAP